MRGEMSFATRLQAGVGAWILGSVVACHRPRLQLYRDPTDHQSSGRAPLALYTVEWWVPLVLPPAWEYLPGEPAPPAADPEGGRIIVLTRDKMVRAIGVHGRIEWSFATRGGATASALVGEGVVYVPGGDGIVYR